MWTQHIYTNVGRKTFVLYHVNLQLEKVRVGFPLQVSELKCHFVGFFFFSFPLFSFFFYPPLCFIYSGTLRPCAVFPSGSIVGFEKIRLCDYKGLRWYPEQCRNVTATSGKVSSSINRISVLFHTFILHFPSSCHAHFRTCPSSFLPLMFLTFKHWTEYIFSFQMAQFGTDNSHICKYDETTCFHGNEVRKKGHTRRIRNLLSYVQIKSLNSLFSHNFSWDYCSRKNWNKISEENGEFWCSCYAYVYLVYVRLGVGRSNWKRVLDNLTMAEMINTKP